jgi:hypothetical protein
MIEVFVKGRPQRIAKYLIKRAAETYAEKLFSPQMLANLDLTVRFVQKDHPDFGKGFCAVCFPQYEQDKTSRPRIFEIVMANCLPTKFTLLTLAHEMVHMKQFAKGELFEFCYKPGRMRFKGEQFNEDEWQGDKYWYSPWEIEAMGWEYPLVRSFIMRMKDEGIDVNVRFRYE